MTFDAKQLLRPSGTINRGPYALIGILGFALKHNLDRLVAHYGFHRPWDLFNYWVPLQDAVRITQLSGDEAKFLATMVALALPFIWIGVVLTMKRLRSIGWPVPLVALFFLPSLNLLFFLVLCLIPPQEPERPRGARDLPKARGLARVVPASAVGSAAVSLLITVPLGYSIGLLGTQVLINYGWGVFVALPFTMGLGAALLYGLREPRTMKGCVGVALLSVTLLGAAFLALAFEGAICLVMAAPIALPLAAFGGVVAYVVQRHRWFPTDSPAFLAVLLLVAPSIQGIEHAAAMRSPVFMVRTHIDVQAPPEKVWKQVVAFTEIAPPHEWIFRAGVAYPIRAEMFGSGPGAERHCVFSTGSFVEPIQVWDEPHLLKFSVTSNPAPMQEWTPYRHVDPPHLHGFLESEGGQFLLTPLANGGTRLEGTTWYHHGLWPSTYWRLWSDAIIHRIHLRVLEHIREEAESRPN